MVIFKWEKKLEVGIALIDGQHKKIIESANAFFISYKCGDAHTKTAECLSFLEQYVLYHFQAEEAFQVDCGYPDYRTHQAAHNSLSTQVKFHATKLLDSQFAQEDIDSFHTFITDWIVTHILEEDTRFADYYLTAKSGQGAAQ